MRISDWSSDVCSSDLGAGQFAKEDPAWILVHHRRAARRVGAQIVEDALHRRLAGLEFAAVEQQLADADIIAAVLAVVTDTQDRHVGQAQASRTLDLQKEKLDRKSTRLNSSH